MNLLFMIVNIMIKEIINVLKNEKVKSIKRNKFNGYIFLTGPGVFRYKEYTK